MRAAIDDEEMVIEMLNGRPERFDPLISALDVLGEVKRHSHSSLSKVSYFRKSNEINKALKVLFIKLKKAHLFQVNVMSHWVAAMAKT